MVSIIFTIIFVVISVVFHEVAHGFVSYKLGDPTPKFDNRLSFDPRNHITTIGAVLFLLLILWQYMWFGPNAIQWLSIMAAILFAKPVIVNPAYYKYPLRDKMLVALAWPGANLLLAFIGFVIMFFYIWLAWYTHLPLWSDFFSDPILSLRSSFCILNISLALFNLIPLPPLDWFSVLTYFFPSIHTFLEQTNVVFLQYFFVLLLLWPLNGLVDIYMYNVLQFVFDIFFFFLRHIFF